MATIDSLNTSILDMSHDEALKLIISIRESRRRAPEKRATNARRKVTRVTMTQVQKALSAAEMLEVLKQMGEV